MSTTIEQIRKVNVYEEDENGNRTLVQKDVPLGSNVVLEKKVPENKELNLLVGEKDIEANKITAFIGPSGCGKSTLLKSLNRMNDMVEGCRITGKIILDGEEIFNRKMDVNQLRKKVGMVLQKPNACPMSI